MDRIMPTSSNSNELAKLLVLLEAAEEERNRGPDAALKQLARLHEEAKAEVKDAHPPIRCENPMGARILLARLKGRDQGL
jgi:hypothetical protein